MKHAGLLDNLRGKRILHIAPEAMLEPVLVQERRLLRPDQAEPEADLLQHASPR